MPTLKETETWARRLHADQTDKAGEPYIGHVLRVHQNLRRMFPDCTEDTQHAAILHDTIEDCGIEADDLRRRGYSEDTIQIVLAVTKDMDDGRTYAERIEHLAQSGPRGALQVKIADLTDNCDPARLAVLPFETSEVLRKRYSKALKTLNAALTA